MPEPAQSWWGFGHEGGFEPMRPRRRLHRALQQEPVESGGDGIGAMLQIDFELPGTGLLHDGVDGETLDLANPVDVVDEGRERVHLLEAEGERLAGIAGDAFRRLKREAAIAVLARDVELKLDGGDRNLSRAGEALDLIGEHGAGIEFVLVLDRHDHLPVLAVADGNGTERAGKQVALVVQIARLPQAGRSPRCNCRAGP